MDGENCFCLRILHLLFLLDCIISKSTLVLLPHQPQVIPQMSLPWSPYWKLQFPQISLQTALQISIAFAIFMLEHHYLTYYTFYLLIIFTSCHENACSVRSAFFFLVCLIHCYLLRTFLEMCLAYIIEIQYIFVELIKYFLFLFIIYFKCVFFILGSTC